MGLFDGLFGKAKSEPAQRPTTASTRPGSLSFSRKLTTALTPIETIDTLEAVCANYRERQYPDLPLVTPAGYWAAPAAAPESFWELRDQAGEKFFVGVWADGTLGVFALAQSDLDNTTLFGNWKMRDSSLTSIGRFEPGTVGLAAPQVPPGYIAEILAHTGFPSTSRNSAFLAGRVGQMYVAKASSFIEQGLRTSSNQFSAAHQSVVDEASLQSILDDLFALPGAEQFFAYAQDIPIRIRALLIQSRLGGLAESLPDQPS